MSKTLYLFTHDDEYYIDDELPDDGTKLSEHEFPAHTQFSTDFTVGMDQEKMVSELYAQREYWEEKIQGSSGDACTRYKYRYNGMSVFLNAIKNDHAGLIKRVKEILLH